MDLDNIFKYHAPSADDTVAYEKLRSSAKDFAKAIIDLTPACAGCSGAVSRSRGRASAVCTQHKKGLLAWEEAETL